MKRLKSALLLLTLVAVLATVVAARVLSRLDPEQIQAWLASVGWLAPVGYIVIYLVATVLVLPSTALNLLGGALFGLWWGTLWTSLAAIVAAMVTFAFTRTIGRDWVAQRLAGWLGKLDGEMQEAGLLYIIAIRLMPIFPYGLVNAVAGLTGIPFRDYWLGTLLGTVPGVLPFVWLGSSGYHALQTGNVWPVLAALGVIGLLVGGGTYYRRSRKHG
ncbi:MAG: TVP38/TMEM64 family protein [Cyanobacteriota bacterium]|nr:TVP38/TMEM64 family protein [Cyanobacteriota bacterium]